MAYFTFVGVYLEVRWLVKGKVQNATHCHSLFRELMPFCISSSNVPLLSHQQGILLNFGGLTT